MDAAPSMTGLKLRFQAKVLNRLYDDFDDTSIIKMPDGTLEVEVALPENEWLYGYLLSFGQYLEVLEPVRIRNLMADRLRQTLEIYGLKDNFAVK